MKPGKGGTRRREGGTVIDRARPAVNDAHCRTMPEHASEFTQEHQMLLDLLLIKDGRLGPDFDDEARLSRVSALAEATQIQRIVGEPGDPGNRLSGSRPRKLQHAYAPLMSGTNAIHGIVVPPAGFRRN